MLIEIRRVSPVDHLRAGFGCRRRRRLSDGWTPAESRSRRRWPNGNGDRDRHRMDCGRWNGGYAVEKGDAVLDGQTRWLNSGSRFLVRADIAIAIATRREPCLE